MQNELDIVRDVAARLEGAGIAYMLTGSMAMNYYAQPRMTRDMVLASLPPGLPEAERKRRLFQRIYGEPLPSLPQPTT